MESGSNQRLAAPMISRKNGEIHFDLNLIPLKKQVNVIWLSKVIANNSVLEKRTGISEIYIDYILDHREEILKRWSCSQKTDQQETEEEQIQHKGLHYILMEWSKRVFWDGHRSIGPTQIENKADELRKRLCLPKYQISSDFWEELNAFKLKEIDNYMEREYQSLNIKDILDDCDCVRIDQETYKKFSDRLRNPGQVPSRKRSKQRHEAEVEAETMYPIVDKPVDAIDNDVILIEEPIECIDVDMFGEECSGGNVDILPETCLVVAASKETNDALLTSEQIFNKDNNDIRMGTLIVKAEPEPSDTEAYEDISLHQTLESTIKDSGVNNHNSLLETTTITCDDNAVVSTKIKIDPEEFRDEEQTDENSNKNTNEEVVLDKDTDIIVANEAASDFEDDTYVDIVEEDDEMLLLVADESLQKSSKAQDVKEMQNEGNGMKERRQSKSIAKSSISKRKFKYPQKISTISKPKEASKVFLSAKELLKSYQKQSIAANVDESSEGEGKRVSKVVPSAKEILKSYHKQQAIVADIAESSDDDSNDEITKGMDSTDVDNNDDGIDTDLELELPQEDMMTVDTNDRHANTIEIEYNPGQKISDMVEEQYEYELLDNLIYEWSKRYILNRIKPELKPRHIILKANKLKAKLNLPNYSVHIQLWNDIFAYKARKKFRRNVKIKSSMNIVKILREGEFGAPRKTYFKFMNILKNRMTAADGELRTYIGKSDSKEKTLISVNDSIETTNEIEKLKTYGGRRRAKNDNTSSPADTEPEANSIISHTSLNASMECVTEYGEKSINKNTGTAHGENKTNSLGFHDTASTSTDYDIIPSDLPNLRVLNVVHNEMVEEPIEVPETFNKNVKTEKESLDDDLPIIDDNELFLPNIREIEQSENVYNDLRTGVIYNISEVVNQEDNLIEPNVQRDKEQNENAESTLDDDAFFFSTHELEMMAKKIDEPIFKIKQEMPEDNAYLLENQLMDKIKKEMHEEHPDMSGEDEFICCKETVKQEQTEDGLDGSKETEATCNKNKPVWLHEMYKTPTTIDFMTLDDSDNEDIQDEIFKVLGKRGLENLDLTENEEDLNSASISKNLKKYSPQDPDDNECLEVPQITEGEKEAEDDVDGEETTELDYLDKEDNNMEMVQNDSDENVSQDNAVSFIQELDNFMKLSKKPTTATTSKRKTRIKAIGRTLKKICLESNKSNVEQNPHQNKIQINQFEADDNENHNDLLQDGEDSVMILEIVSDDEDVDDHDSTQTTDKARQVTTSKTKPKSTASKKLVRVNNLTETDVTSKCKSNEKTRKSKSPSFSHSIPMEQLTLNNTTAAIEYVKKLKDFFRQRNHEMGLQLSLNLELTFIYHDIG